MKRLKEPCQTIFMRLKVFGWACTQIWTASPAGAAAIVFLLFIQGITPGLGLLSVKWIVNLIANNASYAGATHTIVGLTMVWGSILLAEGILEPIVLLVRARLNLRMLARCNLILMNKANSYNTLESFGDSNLYDEMQLIREEAKYRPLNYCYSIFCAFKELVAVFSILIALFSVQHILPLLLILCCIPSAVSTIWLGQKGWDFSLFRGPISRKLAWLAGLTLDEKATKEIRLFDLGDYLTNRYAQLANSFSLGSKSEHIRLCFTASALSFLTIGGYVSLLLWMLTNSNLMSQGIGVIAISTQAFFLAQQQLNQLLQSLGLLSQNLPFFKHLQQFIFRPVKQQKITTSAPTAFSQITFNDVSFLYPDGRVALSNVNLTINKGETLAIVGANGAGKSTFINLLTRLYEPTQGQILIDGVDISQIDITSWRRLITAVFQDFTLYRFSLSENIRIGDLQKPLQNLQEAACKGGIDALAKTLPDRYNTLIGREFGGTSLSGGEEQKLAMSRAFFRDAPIVIFDEPTAALDPKSEQEMFQRVWKEAHNRTLILVTHRLGSVSMANRILVFKNGTVIEEGSHDALLQAQGEYATLYHLQASLYLDGQPLFASSV